MDVKTSNERCREAINLAKSIKHSSTGGLRITVDRSNSRKIETKLALVCYLWDFDQCVHNIRKCKLVVVVAQWIFDLSSSLAWIPLLCNH